MLKQLLKKLYKKLFKKQTKFIVKGDINRIKIGKNTHIDESVILNNSKGGLIEIGDNCHLFENVIVATYGGNIKIGNYSSINPFCVLYGHGGLTIGNEVRMAAQTVIVPSNHIFKDLDTPIRLQGIEKKGVIIQDNVWIGTGAKILDGVIVEKNAIVGAGAVVTKNVRENSIVGGVPAKIIKIRD